jgi:hypothetical protein
VSRQSEKYGWALTSVALRARWVSARRKPHQSRPCPFASLLPLHNLSYGASRPDTPPASRSAGSKSPYSPFTNRTTFSCTASAMRRFETRPRSRCRISPSSSFRRRFTKSRTRPALRDPYRGLNLCRSSLVLTLMGTRGLTRRGCFCWASTHRCCLVPAF